MSPIPKNRQMREKFSFSKITGTLKIYIYIYLKEHSSKGKFKIKICKYFILCPQNDQSGFWIGKGKIKMFAFAGSKNE